MCSEQGLVCTYGRDDVPLMLPRVLDVLGSLSSERDRMSQANNPRPRPGERVGGDARGAPGESDDFTYLRCSGCGWGWDGFSRNGETQCPLCGAGIIEGPTGKEKLIAGFVPEYAVWFDTIERKLKRYVNGSWEPCGDRFPMTERNALREATEKGFIKDD